MSAGSWRIRGAIAGGLLAVAATASGVEATSRASVASDGGQAAGGSHVVGVSEDGRSVFFASSAPNLVPGVGTPWLYVRDRLAGTTSPVFLDLPPVSLARIPRFDTMSRDGAVLGVTDQVQAGPASRGGPPPFALYPYVHDRASGVTSRIDVASDGAAGNDQGWAVALSADGRVAAFVSSSTNLVPGDSNGVADIFVRDRLAGTTTRASVATGGAQANGPSSSPVLGADGRIVAFLSEATNLVPGGTPAAHVYVHDRATGVTTRVSDGLVPTAAAPTISADGRVVAFLADTRRLYLHDRTTGVTAFVGDGSSREPAMSADGRVVAFTATVRDRLSDGSYVSNLSDVFLHDRTTGATTRISPGGDTLAVAPRVSADGGIVAFQAVTVGGAGGARIFVYDRAAAAVRLASVGHDGAPSDAPSYQPSVAGDGDGWMVVFDSDATNLVPGDTNGATDVFLVHVDAAAAPPAPGPAPANPSPPRRPTRFDFDGDGTADPGVYRPATGEWFVLGQPGPIRWGALETGDVAVPADYDGDGRTDIAVYRASTAEWFVLGSAAGFAGVVRLGSPGHGDVPVPADYDGDGRTDLAVYRTTTAEWFVFGTATGFAGAVRLGAPALGDVPVPADYDGDGKADLAVYRTTTGEWFVFGSWTGFPGAVPLGSPGHGDVPIPADYDGDGRADLAVYRPGSGEWFVFGSATGFAGAVRLAAPAPGDVPVPADYDGDGRADRAIFRASTGEWVIAASSGAATTPTPWGAPTDRPLPAR